jgi:hypothetical protein
MPASVGVNTSNNSTVEQQTNKKWHDSFTRARSWLTATIQYNYNIITSKGGGHYHVQSTDMKGIELILTCYFFAGKSIQGVT